MVSRSQVSSLRRPCSKLIDAVKGSGGLLGSHAEVGTGASLTRGKGGVAFVVYMNVAPRTEGEVGWGGFHGIEGGYSIPDLTVVRHGLIMYVSFLQRMKAGPK